MTDDCEPVPAKLELVLPRAPPTFVPEIVGLEDGVEAPADKNRLQEMEEVEGKEDMKLTERDEYTGYDAVVENALPNLYRPITRYVVKDGHVEKVEDVTALEIVRAAAATSTSITPVANKHLSNDWVQSYMMNNMWQQEVISITAVDPDNASNIQASVEYALPYGMKQFGAHNLLVDGRLW